MNIGTLSIFPSEILSKILEDVRDDFRSIARCLFVSHDFRDLIVEVRSDRGAVVRSSFFRSFPSIRKFHGSVLLDSWDELEFFLEGSSVLDVSRNLQVYLPDSLERRAYKNVNAPGLMRALKRQNGKNFIVNIHVLLGTLIIRVLELVRKRIRRHPNSTVAVHLSRFLRVWYRRGHCHLHIPLTLPL